MNVKQKRGELINKPLFNYVALCHETFGELIQKMST